MDSNRARVVELESQLKDQGEQLQFFRDLDKEGIGLLKIAYKNLKGELEQTEARERELKALINETIKYFQGVLLDHLPHSFAENPMLDKWQEAVKK